MFNIRHTILLVEDNKELCYFIKQQFDDEFNIILANDGKQAYEILQSEQVDLIISDLMMPIMNGLELCCKVKENIQISHIPFIILSAQSRIQSKLDALETGADDYIEKPYSYDFLRARIYNLLISRKAIKKTYSKSPSQDIKPIAHTKTDEQFLTKLIDTIHDNIDSFNLFTFITHTMRYKHFIKLLNLLFILLSTLLNSMLYVIIIQYYFFIIKTFLLQNLFLYK